MLVATQLAQAQLAITSEYRNKVSFLATFPSFIEWPENAFQSADAPFVVCVLGDFRFGTSLAEVTRSTTVHGRRVDVRWVHKDQDLRSCHILFVSRSESKRFAQVLQTVQGAEVLTVGETPDFLGAGGALNFVLQNGTLQFEVNLVAANGAHFRVTCEFCTMRWPVKT